MRNTGQSHLQNYRTGNYYLKHEYVDDEGLLSWMLSLRDKVTVIEPESIREELLRIAVELTEKYKEGLSDEKMV